MHSVDGDRRRKYLTLHGMEVCATEWYLIYGILKSTFHSYVQRYNEVVYQQHKERGAASDHGLEQFKSWILLLLS